jgi:putative Mg2+ transporter-C (MgtC) family protein
VTCRSPDEAHIRALLLQGLAGGALALRRLDSTDLEGGGRVVVTAYVTATQRVDTDVEKIVGRLSLEPTVSAARWQADVRIEADAHAGEAPPLGAPPLGAQKATPAER